jgi:hypothetical protein
MRKISIGIFAVVTVILFILSTSVSVTAATHRETTMVLESRVREDLYQALVIMTPQNVWDRDNWTWTPDINNGDDVIIDTTCEYLNANYYVSGPPTGYHNFTVEGSYVKGLNTQEDADYAGIYTYGSQGGIPERGSTTITIGFYNLEEGGTIHLYWYVLANNTKYSVTDEDENYGTIYLT